MTEGTASQGELAMRLVGGVWGHLVGDAVGVPYEFRDADQVGDVRWGETGTHDQPPGTWSDDGALMLALLDSLTAKGVGFDVEDQGRRALAWWRDGAYTPDGDGCFDIGGTTSMALRAIEDGTPAADAGPTDEWSCGNGSLMRILPVALVGRDLDAAALIDQACRASRVTHGHPRCQVACALYVLAARNLLRGRARSGRGPGERRRRAPGRVREPARDARGARITCSATRSVAGRAGCGTRSGAPGRRSPARRPTRTRSSAPSPTATTPTRPPRSPAASRASTGASTGSPTSGSTGCAVATWSCRWSTRCSRARAGGHRPGGRCGSIGSRPRTCRSSAAGSA